MMWSFLMVAINGKRPSGVSRMLSCLISRHRAILFVSIVRLRDRIGLPLTSTEPIYGRQLHLPAIFRFNANG